MSRKLHHKAAGHVTRLQSEFDVAALQITGDDFRHICKRWLEIFCPNVKRNTGKWVYNGFRWHAYSFGHEKSIVGADAFDAYSAKSIKPFYAYFECDDLLFDCTASTWPDLRPLEDDIYIFPHRMTWSFITTHEMSLDLGPYFAESSAGER